MLRRLPLRLLLPGAAVLAAALAFRLPALTAGLPYLNYVDEGHVLHHVVHLLRTGGWDPEWYTYPSLPLYAAAVAARLYSPVYAAVHGRPLAADLSPSPPLYYDLIAPAELIVLGRLATLAAALGVVALAGLLARRLAGSAAAGWLAAWAAALVPALVVRGAIVTVDPWAALFVLAALLSAERARAGGHYLRDAALAGAMTGLALAAKYPAALVGLAVTFLLLVPEVDPEHRPAPGRARARSRLRALVLAAGAGLAAACLAMPALLFANARVLENLARQSIVYSRQVVGSYWDQAVRWGEWDQPLPHPEVGLPFLALAAGGLAVALADRRLRPTAAAWLLYAAATGWLLSGYGFRAFRNLLPLVPLACVLVALLADRVAGLTRRPAWVHAAAAALLAALFLPADLGYARDRRALVDSRVEAVDWLAAHAGPRDRVLLVEELALAPTEVARLGGRAIVRPWPAARARMRRGDVRYLVLGELAGARKRPLLGDRDRDEVRRRFAPRARFGEWPGTGKWRGNRQVVTVLEARPRAGGGINRGRSAGGTGPRAPADSPPRP